MRMPLESDTEEIIDLSFIPVGGWPYAGHGGNDRLGAGQRDFESQKGIPFERQQLIDDGEAAFRTAEASVLGERVLRSIKLNLAINAN